MKSTLYAISSKAERVNITEVILHNEELYRYYRNHLKKRIYRKIRGSHIHPLLTQLLIGNARTHSRFVIRY